MGLEPTTLGFSALSISFYYMLIYYACSCSWLTISLRNKCNKHQSLGDGMRFRGNIKLRLSHHLVVFAKFKLHGAQP